MIKHFCCWKFHLLEPVNTVNTVDLKGRTKRTPLLTKKNTFRYINVKTNHCVEEKSAVFYTKIY